MNDDRAVIRCAAAVTQPDREFEPGRELPADIDFLRVECLVWEPFRVRFIGVALENDWHARLSAPGLC